jgi:hypothetical protein
MNFHESNLSVCKLPTSTVCVNQTQLKTVACESIPPLGIFPILLPYNLDLKWIFGRFVSFDSDNMPTCCTEIFK